MTAQYLPRRGDARCEASNTDHLDGLVDPFQAGAVPCQQYCTAGPCAPSCLRMNDPNPIPMDDGRRQRTAARIRGACEFSNATQPPNIPAHRASEIHQGRSAPTAGELAAYAEAFGMTVDSLLTGVGFKAARAAAQEKL